MLEHLTVETFKQKVFNYDVNQDWKFEGDLPCIIDFYADWCAPCKMVAPILEELAKEYEGKINIYKVNTEEEQELAYVFGIQSIPSLLFCPKDDRPQMAVGALPKQTFIEIIESILLKNKVLNTK
jgi:thioredoxin